MSNLELSRGAVLAVIVLGAGLVGGCQSWPSSWGPEVKKHIEDSLEDARTGGQEAAARPVPEEVREALLPPLQVQVPRGRPAPAEERFDLVVDNAPVRQVFMGLVEGTDLGMVIHPDVDGVVTLNLKNVTVDEALAAIRDVYGFEYRRQGNRYLILSPGLQTRIFRVNYLNLNRSGKSETRVSSSELSQTVEGSSSGGASGATRRQTTMKVPTIQVQTTSQADFWVELRQALTELVGTDQGRRVVVNPQAGLVVVKAPPGELRMVEEYLGATEDVLARQVILEAKILEVELNDGFQSGVNWSRLYADRGGSDDVDFRLGQVGGGTSINDGTSEIAGNAGNLDPSMLSPITGTVSSAFGGVFTLAIEATNFAAFVELLKTQGDVHVLSSPRVSTVNNQKAVIKVGAEKFFITGVTSSGTTAEGATTAPTVELTPLFSGIALDVTPQIDQEHQITLHIHPSVSEVSQRNESFVIGSEDFNLPLAFGSIQVSDSIVRARSGQVIVIGGLMKEGSTDENAAVPLLGDVPVMGNLFKHKKVTRIKKELVILVKPTVIESGDHWSAAIQESQDRVQRYRQPVPQ
jgi:MSHA biogenesis protein MshL